VILIAVVGLIDVKEIVHLWKTDRRDLVLLLVTLLATLVAGIQEGIAIGVGLSLALVLYKSSHPHVAILGRLPGTTIYRNVNRFKDAQEIKGVLIMRFDAQLFFANAHIFYKLIDDALVDRDGLKLVVVNAEAINTLDSTAAHMLTDLADDLRRADVDLVFTGVKGPVRDIMMKNRIVDKLGKGHFFNTIQEAIDHFDGEHLDEKEESTFQTNLI
jgi:SulP family sulfate permease